MSKQRMPLGLRKRVEKPKDTTTNENSSSETPKIESAQKELARPKKEIAKAESKGNPPKKGKGRPSTKKGKKLVKYSMDIHPELKRAVVKAAAIYDKDVHVMWNEIIFDWFTKENKKNPDWYKSIKVDKSDL